jgi:hypothetical protein
METILWVLAGQTVVGLILFYWIRRQPGWEKTEA